LNYSQDITDGVNKSAQAVQAAEAGIRQIGTLAHQHTICKLLCFLLSFPSFFIDLYRTDVFVYYLTSSYDSREG